RPWKFAALGRAKSAPERWTAGAPACWSDSPPANTAPPARRPAPCLSARHARAVESARGRAPGARVRSSRARPRVAQERSRCGAGGPGARLGRPGPDRAVLRLLRSAEVGQRLTQTLQRVAHLHLDRLRGDAEAGRDLPVSQSCIALEGEDLAHAVRQHVDRRVDACSEPFAL